MKKTRAWLVVLLAVCLIGGGGVAALAAAQAFPGFQLFGGKSETRTTQIINAVTREQQVVLLSLAIQGITTKEQGPTTFLGVEVPGTERAAFLEYRFKAKVGLDGKYVHIQQTGEKEYLVSIPRFIFIGHSDENFRVAAENNGMLSFASAPIETTEMINTLLNDEAQRTYVTSNEELLRDQAKVFYTGIISGIDAGIALDFEFQS